jgi:hypothetical protein
VTVEFLFSVGTASSTVLEPNVLKIGSLHGKSTCEVYMGSLHGKSTWAVYMGSLHGKSIWEVYILLGDSSYYLIWKVMNLLVR